MIASSSRTKLPISNSLCYASVCIPIRSPRLQRRHRSSGVEATGDVSEQLREVMRAVPQPVALAVTRIPPNETTGAESPRYHGATLSSFTSLTLHPHPLVAFSLRLPSRLADYLRSDASSSPTTLTSPRIPSPSSTPFPNTPNGKSITISLLSQTHAELANQFSKFSPDQSSLFDPSSGHFDSCGDPSAVKDAIGTLSCEVVSSLPLKDICETPSEDDDADIEFDSEVEGAGLYNTRSSPPDQSPTGTRQEAGSIHGSELFICKVTKVGMGKGPNSQNPMLYWNQQYTSVQGAK